MRARKKTWVRAGRADYGTQRKATVSELRRTALIVIDDRNEGHILFGINHDRSLMPGDVGTITFREGGPLGGYWKFDKKAGSGVAV